MRATFLTLFAALAAFSYGQSRSGTYRAGGSSMSWSIDDAGCLRWDGSPYLPIGAAIEGTPAAIERARAAGVQDALVDLPAAKAGWETALAALASTGMRHVVRVSSLAPLAPGIAVDPAGYRVPGITAPRNVTVSLPGATSVLAVLVSSRDGYIVRSERVPVVNGTLSYDVKPSSTLDHVLLLYPVTTGLEMPDFWEGLDRTRDTLLTTLRQAKLGPGLRGIVNPMGRTLSLPGRELRFVPNSAAFRLELAGLLESRYRSVETLQRSWSMSGSSLSTRTEEDKPLATFLDLARLVPLWSGTRGVPQLWDPATDRLYGCESRKSQIWRDINDAVNNAGVRRFDRLVAAIRRVADVPVVQEWNGWAAPYETRQAALDGVAFRADAKAPGGLVEAAARPVSSALRWPQKGWLVATGLSGFDNVDAIGPNLDDLASMGVRGAFIEAPDDAGMRAVAALSGRWAGDATLAVSAGSAIFFPENATNPAHSQRLPGGRWWLPTPSDGNRIDLGRDFFAYRMRIGDATMLALWARQPARVKLRMATPKVGTFTTLDGSDPMVKVLKDGVEVNLGEMPLMVAGTDEVPIPQPAYEALVVDFKRLIESAQARHKDAPEERSTFDTNLAGFDLNPGGTFPILLEMFYRASSRLGNFSWIEAELPRETNFSEAVAEPSCSNRSALSLRTPIPPETVYFAEYSVSVRSAEEQQVWLAARIPADQRRNVQILIGGQTLTLQGDPVSPYGNGFAWFRLGATRLAGANSRLRLTVISPDGADLAVDAILLTPSAFAPTGIAPPVVTSVGG